MDFLRITQLKGWGKWWCLIPHWVIIWMDQFYIVANLSETSYLPHKGSSAFAFLIINTWHLFGLSFLLEINDIFSYKHYIIGVILIQYFDTYNEHLIISLCWTTIHQPLTISMHKCLTMGDTSNGHKTMWAKCRIWCICPIERNQYTFPRV